MAMTHGDRPADVRRLRALEPDYLLFGHSHRPADLKRGPTRWINPGALHRARNFTVAILDLERDALRWLRVDGGRGTRARGVLGAG